MNLTIDIGNTSTKIVVFRDKKIIVRKKIASLSLSFLRSLMKRYPIDKVIISSVAKNKFQSDGIFKSMDLFIQLSSSTKVPVRISYKTPHTLGNDRLASVVGAASIFPNQNILVIDAGTCIKYDFINSKKEYFGGSISPGMMMRFRALHEYTGKLPLVKPQTVKELTGSSTKESILTGVMLGIENEMHGFINLYSKRHKRLEVVMTGGDLACFAGRLNFHIFAAAELVNVGLNEILLYHAEK